MERINGTLHEDLGTFILSRWILLRMEYDSNKRPRKNQNTHFVLSNFTNDNRVVWEIIWKTLIEEIGHSCSMVHVLSMLDTLGYRHNLRICKNYWFFFYCRHMNAPQCDVIFSLAVLLFDECTFLLGRLFDPSWCQWIFNWHKILPIALWPLGSTQPLTEMSTRSITWGKGGWCVRLTTLPPSCAVVTKSDNLNFLEPSGPLQVYKGTSLTFTTTMAELTNILCRCHEIWEP